jgi:IS1 family transposase
MNRLPLPKRAQMLGLLVEGNSVRATSRLADVSFNTALKFVSDMGRACADYQDDALRNLKCQRIQVDEIWSFVGVKQRNATDEQKAEGLGDVWTWTAIEADTKLAVSWLVADRSYDSALAFMQDIKSRLANRVQLTSDGHGPYLKAVEDVFGDDIDFAQLVKIYGPAMGQDHKRYSPPVCVGARRETRIGNPDEKKISTSYVERSNLTMRMGIRRFTRLTNAFSKKVENHAAAVAMHFMWYNFGRVHKTLKVTPAMGAGVTDHVWTLEEIAAVDVQEAPKVRGPYKKRGDAQISN